MQNKNNIEYISTTHEKANFFAKQDDQVEAANQYLIAAYHYTTQGNPEKAIECYLQCALCHVKLNDYQVAAQFYRMIANQYRQLGDHDNADKNKKLSEEYFKKIGYEILEGH